MTNEILNGVFCALHAPPPFNAPSSKTQSWFRTCNFPNPKFSYAIKEKEKSLNSGEELFSLNIV
jgi:hypothetical protein